ncbi:MAG: DEAD/DEAH box helicase, partial [Chloroflexota bacterium]|nr:DEAD/DEAH box helicase [Chloroflexota bacterium]
MIDGLKERRQQQWEAPAHVWIVSYETLREDLPAVRRLQEFELVILDEAAKVKNPSARITRAVRDLPRARCWALTATPLENKPDDLVSILRLIAVTPPVETRVKNIEAALPRWEHWLTPEEKEKLMQPIMLRRRQEDVLDLPPVVEEELWLELTPEQRGAYDAAYAEAQDTVRELGESVTKVHVLAQLQKLKQLCNFDPKTDSSAKADFLVEHLRDVAPEDKILVFSQYPNASLPLLSDRLQNDFQMLDIYHGGLSLRQRDDLRKMFEDDPRYRVLLMGLKAGGVGLNLQKAANHVVLFDHWWNPATHKQALGRVLRIGQDKTVFTTPLFTRGTVEQEIYKKLQRKEKLFKAYVDDPSEAQKEVEQSLTLEDLLEVLDLPLPEQRPRQEKMDSLDSQTKCNTLLR